MAGQLVENNIDFPIDLETNAAIEFGIRHGLFDSKWSNAWRYYSALSKNCDQLVRYLLPFLRLPKPAFTTVSIYHRSRTLLIEAIAEVQPSHGIAGLDCFADELAQEIVNGLTSKTNYEWLRWWFDLLPSDLDAKLRAVSSLTKGGYSHHFCLLYTSDAAVE